MTTLIGGFLVWGGVGWLLDHWWGTRLMTPIGLILGMALGIYAVIAKVGTPNAAEMSPALRAASTTRHSGTASPIARQIARHEEFAGIPQSSTSQSSTPEHNTDKPQRRDGPPPAATRRETECP
ncbi:MAG TPA: AtpZ/AtpI family protein [Nakamurella sp.]|nr:AtpZ/AtpI family protein [Nakamurella sp.]